VAAVGEGVTKWRAGDRVFGGGVVGAYAERIVVAEEGLLPMPPGMSFEEAAAIYLTLPTSYAALHQRGALRAGEWCLVLAAAGGVGMAAGASRCCLHCASAHRVWSFAAA
jgi:NADPH2:quinone reductase